MLTKLPYRTIITTPPNFSLISLDLSAAETWVVAHLANDQNMKRELIEGDIHSFSACVIHDLPVPPGQGKSKYKGLINEEQRYLGKKTNHSSSYRTSPYKLCEAINKDGTVTVSLHQVKRWHTLWHQTFLIRRWWNDIEDNLRQNSNTLTTTYNRSRTFYGIWNDDLLKEATAYEPQSTVADHMRGRLHPEFGIPGGIREIRKQITSKHPEIKLIQSAYDSVLMEVPDDVVDEIGEQCRSILLRPLVIRGETFTIPVDCDIYPKRWGEDKRSLRQSA